MQALLSQAESLLLTPFSLTEADLSRTFGQILSHQAAPRIKVALLPPKAKEFERAARNGRALA